MRDDDKLVSRLTSTTLVGIILLTLGFLLLQVVFYTSIQRRMGIETLDSLLVISMPILEAV